MDEQKAPSGSGPRQCAPGDRLDSWKEIATYLKREVRTVQRWEKTAGLPVRRLQVDKQGPVYAYKSELDSWFSERQPRLDEEAEHEGGAEARKGPRMRWSIIGALVAAAMLVSAGVYFLAYGRWTRKPSMARKARLVVLPFQNLSGDATQDYFSDGMTEEMITQLGKLDHERLGIIARTSAMFYKNTRKSTPQICDELNVDYLLEGSVTRAENRARITAQLIQCTDQTHIWADSSEQDLGNILALQDDFAQAIAKNIKLVLTPEQRTRLRARGPVRPEAYQAYLKGMYLLWKPTPDSITTALKFFQEAIKQDASYSQSYAALAQCYVSSALLGQSPPQQAYSNAKAAAGEAMALGDTLAETHLALAEIATWYEWDWATAEREYRRAIELDPNLALAHLGYGHLHMLLRRPDQAWTELRAAQGLDPVSQVTGETWVISLYESRKYDEAIVTAKQWLELYPDFHLWLGEIYAQKGMESLALEEFLKAEELGNASPSRIAALQIASRKSGIRGFWQTKTVLDEETANPGFMAYDVAYDYAAVGDRDRSLSWLEKAYNEHDWRLPEAVLEPRFDSLRSDPRFQDLLHRIGLPP